MATARVERISEGQSGRARGGGCRTGKGARARLGTSMPEKGAPKQYRKPSATGLPPRVRARKRPPHVGDNWDGAIGSSHTNTRPASSRAVAPLTHGPARHRMTRITGPRDSDLPIYQRASEPRELRALWR
jgi:hypothetical protein